ncbi:MAG: hypothetical protein WCK29_02645 [archaeon]
MNKIILRILGAILILVGIVLMIWSLINFVSYVSTLSHTNDASDLGLLMSKVIYRLIPFFTGIISAVIGFYILLFSSIGLLINSAIKGMAPVYDTINPIIEKQSEAAARGFRKGFKGKV